MEQKWERILTKVWIWRTRASRVKDAEDKCLVCIVEMSTNRRVSQGG